MNISTIRFIACAHSGIYGGIPDNIVEVLELSYKDLNKLSKNHYEVVINSIRMYGYVLPEGVSRDIIYHVSIMSTEEEDEDEEDDDEEDDDEEDDDEDEDDVESLLKSITDKFKSASVSPTGCVYVMLRGQRKGETCGSKVAPGDNRCKPCQSKTGGSLSTAPQTVVQKAVTPQAIQMSGPGLPHTPNGMAQASPPIFVTPPHPSWNVPSPTIPTLAVLPTLSAAPPTQTLAVLPTLSAAPPTQTLAVLPTLSAAPPTPTLAVPSPKLSSQVSSILPVNLPNLNSQ
jgi:hypothetical protein